MMDSISPVLFGVVGVIMAVTVIFVRLRAAKKPVSVRKLVLPPLMMSTGFLMFHFPEVITPISYDLIAFVCGMILSIPLILSTKFQVVGNDIYLKRSNTFIFVLFALFLIRLAVKLWMGDAFTPMQTAGLFFVLAFGMISTWRVALLIRYRQLTRM